jgi:hypothetical protein
MAIGAPDVAWALLYRCVRLELLRKVGSPYEDPAELAQAQWDAVSMPEKMDYESIETALLKLNRARMKMVRTRRFDETPQSVSRELTDLRRKVRPGTGLKVFFASLPYQPASFDQWLEVVWRYQATLPRPKHQGARLAYEGDDYGNEAAEGYDEEGWEE